MPKLYKFSVPGVVCGACAVSIENSPPISDKITIENIYVNIADKTVTYKITDTTLSELAVKEILIATVNDAGFECLEIQQISYSKTTKTPTKSIRSHVLKGIIGILTGAVLLGLYISGFVIPLLGLYCLAIISTLLTFFLGKESYYEAAVGLKHKRTTMDTLFAISTLIASGISIASLFFPWLPMMYDAALLIFGFRHIGKAIEESVNYKIEKGLTFRARAPQEIESLTAAGKFVKTKVCDLLPNDLIIVRRGGVIPVDGECETEKATVYNTIISGRTLPQTVRKGSPLYAGCKIDVDEVRIRVKKTEPESYLAQLDLCLNQPGEEAALEKWANNIMKYFIPMVLVLAFVSAIAIGVLFSPLTAIQCAIGILVSACPCTFGLITPLAVKIGIVKAAADGIRFKSGQPLQAAAEVDTVVLDLNGTMTKGQPQVSSGKKGVSATNIPPALFDYLAAIEQQSSHPFAKAIRLYINQRRQHSSDDINLKISRLDQSHHSGLVAEINHETFVVGNKKMMLDQGFTEKEIHAVEIPHHSAEHIIYFARGKTLAGCILLSDPLRQDAKALVIELKRMGKEVHLCTGADEKTAKKYAALLGIDKIAADCLGESTNPAIKTKTQYIEELMRKGRKVAMVGDAANDAAAIKKSHLGIAVESDGGDKITQQEAGAVISKLDNQLSLRPIITAFIVGKQTVRNIKHNLAFSLSYNMLTLVALSLLVLFLGFVINPAIGAALMFLQAAIILANAYSFQNEKVAYANDPVHASKPNAGSTPDIQRAFKISAENNSVLDKALATSVITSSNLQCKPSAGSIKHYSSDDQLIGRASLRKG